MIKWDNTRSLYRLCNLIHYAFTDDVIVGVALSPGRDAYQNKSTRRNAADFLRPKATPAIKFSGGFTSESETNSGVMFPFFYDSIMGG